VFSKRRKRSKRRVYCTVVQRMEMKKGVVVFKEKMVISFPYEGGRRKYGGAGRKSHKQIIFLFVASS